MLVGQEAALTGCLLFSFSFS